MSAKFRNVGPESAMPGGGSENGHFDPRATHKFTVDEEEGTLDNMAYEGAAAQNPMVKLVIGFAQVIWGCISNCIQVATSSMAWLSMITAQPAFNNIPDFLMSPFAWKVTIALVMGIAPQVLLHMHSQPITDTWMRLKNMQNFRVKAFSSKIEVKKVLNARAFLGYVGLGADVVSDATFVNLFTENILAIIFWMFVLTGCSTICMYDGANKVWGAFEDYRDYKHYHNMHDPKKEKQ
ncbi:MAG TPA: hypothetical protein VHV10_04920 [Ktedonobacteraceae bacterium]|jgi:hypothetical protein|nr:hypothetical protein [Ktedonobacteraceae bacterium]